MGERVIDSELQGRYRILRRLGTGAMGEVFLAEHLLLGRYEAIKVLRASSAQAPEIAARFRREARALNRFTHPNIIKVHDFGQLQDGRFYLAMEYAEGRNFSALLKEGYQLPLVRALHLLAKIADAIAHAHSHRVIHRDLKPANVVLTAHQGHFEEPKVLDFGLAKIVSPDYSDSVAGTAGRALGTPYYMAPEVIANRRFDKRIDIYSLGCLSFELLSGEPPFTGPLMTLCQAHLTKSPPRLSERKRSATVPPELDDLIQSCLQKDPAARIQSAEQVAGALRETARKLGPNRADSPRQQSPEPEPEETLQRRTLKWKAGASTQFGQALGALARAIFSEGCDDLQLLLTYSALTETESVANRYRSELERLRSHRTILTQHFRERDDSLRFVLDRLRLRASRQEHAAPASKQMHEALESLGEQLNWIRTGAERELAEIDEHIRQQSELLRATHETLRDRQYELYEAVRALMPAYENVGIVAHLWGRVVKRSRAAESA